MATSDILANDTDDEQVPTRLLPESGNKRKRGSVAANVNINEETTITDREETGEKHVSAVETSDVKEVVMKDAESTVDQSIKEIEMQDADLNANDQPDGKTHLGCNNETVSDLNASEGCKEGEEPAKVEKSIEDGKTHRKIGNNETVSGLNANECCKEDKEPTNVERSESNKKERNDDQDGSGQHALGEVVTLLKQVQESETNAKLQVEVKMKKMEDGDVKEKGEVTGRVSCT